MLGVEERLGHLQVARAQGQRAGARAPARAGDATWSPRRCARHAAEMAQPRDPRLGAGECEPVPGKTMPNFAVVERDYANLHDAVRLVRSAGARERAGRARAHWPVDDVYDEMARRGAGARGGEALSVDRDARRRGERDPALAPETNGELAWRAFNAEEKKVGLPLADLAEKNRGVRTRFADLAAAAAAAPQQPVLVGPHQGRPHVLGLTPQRRAARPVADAHRPPALLPRPPGLPRVRRGTCRPTSRGRSVGDARISSSRAVGRALAQLPHARTASGTSTRPTATTCGC